MTPAKVIGQRWVVYHYDTIKYHRPQDGELVVFIDPDIQAGNKQFLSFVVGYGNRTVEELRGNTSVTIGLVQQNLEALADSFSAHTAKTDAHSATSVPAANRIAMYDAAKRLHTGADAAADNDAVPYKQLLTLLSALQLAVETGTLRTLINSLADSFSAHTAKTDAHSATPVPAANRIAMYDAAKRLHTGADAELDWNTIPYRQGKQMIDNLRAHIQQQLDAMPVSYVTLDAGIPYVTVTGCYYISQE